MSNGTKKAKAKRSVRVVHAIGSIPHTQDGLISITTPDKTALYWIREVPTQLDGRAFSLSQVCTREEYTCHVGAHTSCECLGFTRHGHCKHTSATKALITAGKIK